MASVGVAPVYAPDLSPCYVYIIKAVYNKQLYHPPLIPPAHPKRGALSTGFHVSVTRVVRHNRAHLKAHFKGSKEAVGLLKLPLKPR
jgi:hypothetical protein